LVAIGLYGFAVQSEPLRRIMSFNLIGAGVFLLFGVAARRGAAAGFLADPIPNAIVITGIVVAFAATALTVTLVLGLAGTAAGRQKGSERPNGAEPQG
jgi:multicomponent Na+:H+ antiporter subunit C